MPLSVISFKYIPGFVIVFGKYTLFILIRRTVCATRLAELSYGHSNCNILRE